MSVKKRTLLWQMQQEGLKGGTCAKCGREVHGLSVDHIVPINILDQLDLTGDKKFEWAENMEMICFPCNRFKSGRLELAHPKTITLLQELINSLSSN